MEVLLIVIDERPHYARFDYNITEICSTHTESQLAVLWGSDRGQGQSDVIGPNKPGRTATETPWFFSRHS